MKPVLLLLLCMFSAFCAGAQDTIVFRSGEKVMGRVVKVNPHTIEYHRADIPDGPVYSKDFNAVAGVMYANGKREVFAPLTPREYNIDERRPERHRPEPRAMKSPQKVKTQGIIMTTIGTTAMAAGLGTLIYGLTQVEFEPTVAGALVTAAGIPFTIIGPIKISRANKQLNKSRRINFDSEIGFNPFVAPSYSATGVNAGLGISLRF